MNFSELIKTRRTVRLFQQKPLDWKDMEDCVDAARLAPSAKNLQLAEYVLVDSPGLRKGMFPLVYMGGQIKDFSGKEPMAYAIILSNREIESGWKDYDVGLAVENLVLAAWAKGIGSCIMARIEKEKIRKLLRIPEGYEIELAVALGYPAEKPVAEDSGQNIEYYRDDKGVLHVPKRPLKSILRRNGF